MPIQAVIFDFGGVLVRTVDQSGRFQWDQVLGMPEGSLYKLVFESQDARLATVGKISEEEHWRRLADRLKLDARQITGLREDFWRGDVLDVRLVEYIRSIHGRVKTAILSNAWSGARDTFVNTYHLGDLFNEIMISAEEGLRKPDPLIFQRLTARLGISPQDCVFVDDFSENVDAARKFGVHGIQFTSTDQVIHELDCLIHS